LESYQLFQYASCPFCRRVLAAMAQHGWSIPLRDTLQDPAARAELVRGGGRATVPCLRIEREDGSLHWLYESADIIAYLERRLS